MANKQVAISKSAARSLLALLVTAFVAFLAFRAAAKPFWFDEILTLSVARQAFGLPMWEALTAGFEYNPPAVHLLTWVAETLMGQGQVTSRLPFILASIPACWGLFRFGSLSGGYRRGALAVLLFMLSGATEYFYEARPYALVLASTASRWRAGKRFRSAVEAEVWHYCFCLVGCSPLWPRTCGRS